MTQAVARNITISINGKEVENSLRGVGKEIGKLKGELRKETFGSEKFNKLNAQLDATKKKYAEMSGSLRKNTKAFQDNQKGVLGNLGSMVKLTLGVTSLVTVFTGLLSAGKQFIGDSREIAEEARGVEFAFEQLGATGENAFNRIKESTRGLLNDLDIKRALVQFDNFNINLEDTDALMEFVAVRATQTGQSFDGLFDSLVEGLSKESKLRIDNLGISTAALNEELKRTPNFVQAVANIAKTEIKGSNAILDNAVSIQRNYNVAIENFQLSAGKVFNNVSQLYQKLALRALEAVTPTDKLSDSLKEQQLELNVLVTNLADVNIKEEERARIIQELNDKYPEFTAQLDIEKATTEQLTIALSQVNDEYINRIVLQKELEEVQKIRDVNNSLRVQDRQREISDLDTLIAAEQSLGIEVDLTISKSQRLAIAQKEAAKQSGFFAIEANKLVNTLAIIDPTVLEGGISRYTQETTDKLNEAISAADELRERLGINEEETTPQPPITPTGPSDEQLKLAEQRKKALADLEAQFLKESEDRLANSEVKKLELQRDRLLQKATDLRASEQLLENIREEFRQRIAIAKDVEEEKELERLTSFEERKKALQDELALLNAETEEENERLKAEQDLEKREEKIISDFEALQLTEEQKTELLVELEKIRAKTLEDIDLDSKAKRLAAEKDLQENRKNLIQDSLDAVINAAGRETKVGQALLLAKQLFAVKESLINLGLFKQKAAQNVAEATSDVAKGSAKAAASAPFPANIPSILGFAAQVAGIISTLKSLASAGQEADLPGLFTGGFTGETPVGIGGDKDGPFVGAVHKNEYVVPEVMTSSPKYANVLGWLEQNRKKEVRGYNDGGLATLTGAALTPDNSNLNGLDINMMVSSIDRLNAILDNGITARTFYGYDDEEARQNIQDDLERSQNNGIITS